MKSKPLRFNNLQRVLILCSRGNDAERLTVVVSVRNVKARSGTLYLRGFLRTKVAHCNTIVSGLK
jgi:hypothetical protein